MSEQGPTRPPEEPEPREEPERRSAGAGAGAAGGRATAPPARSGSRRGHRPRRHGGAVQAPAPAAPPAIIDTRRYRWTIGIFGLILVIAFSVYEFNKHGVVSPGVPAGQRLHNFVAPLATIGPDKPANPRPKCDPAHPNPLALNVCGRTPLVLALFATGSGPCKRQVDTLQAVSHEFRRSRDRVRRGRDQRLQAADGQARPRAALDDPGRRSTVKGRWGRCTELRSVRSSRSRAPAGSWPSG